MRRLIAILLVTFLARTSSAEWTPDTITEYGNQITSLHSMAGTFSRGLEDIKRHPERHADWRRFFESLGINSRSNGMQWHYQGLVWLADGNGQPHTPVGTEFLATATRAEVIARGLDWISRADIHYRNAILKLQIMISEYPECATSRCQAEIVLDIVEGAVARYNEFNPAHDWTEPRDAENIAFSLAAGSTDIRLRSGAAGPHGDYRTWLARAKGVDQYFRHGLYQAIRAGEIANAAARGHLLDMGRGYERLMKLNYVVTGLAVGFEHAVAHDDIEVMFAQGSTGRGRSFFTTTWAIMATTNVIRGGSTLNAFGLQEPPGMAHHIAGLRRQYFNALRAVDGDQAVIDLIAKSFEHAQDGWALLDSMAWRGMIYFNFLNPPFTPPPPSLECGFGTIEVGNQCVIDLAACPPVEGAELVFVQTSPSTGELICRSPNDPG